MEGINKWDFTDAEGTFKLENADKSNYLYFPLANEAGMMSAITPRLHGDSKTGQNTFVLQPVSLEDLHNSRAARNFWVTTDAGQVWSAAGNSARQFAQKFSSDKQEEVTLEAGLLWHKVSRENQDLGLKAEITNFVPANSDTVELMQVKLSNIGEEDIKLTPTAAVPIYGRSADNLRDHRHVTSLLHRIETVRHGVVVKPTLSFDERGHTENEVSYGILGAGENGEEPRGFFPILEDFIGAGGNLDWPEAVVSRSRDHLPAGEKFAGYEAVGALRFEEVTLQPGSEISYILAIAIDEAGGSFAEIAEKYLAEDSFASHLEENKAFWKTKLDKVQFASGDTEFNRWMRWVTVQPILRRIFGCSFLPSHDYGRGGRGWRDLWQDCLALLLMEPEKVQDLLFNNFAGVRIDGSNATIIGSKPGEFKADRNNIQRVWMDHGAWPFLTTRLYLDQSGDLKFLLREQTYFQNGSPLLDQAGAEYRGSIIEHLLVQHLTHFFDVGEHNNFRLRNGDWNDGLDMAAEKGESVAFTAFYGSNLLELADLLRHLEEKEGTVQIKLAGEILPLLDTLNQNVDYDSPAAKVELLEEYRRSCTQGISGEKVAVSLAEVRADLKKKGNWVREHLREDEWIENAEDFSWFNSYYDDDGIRLEGDHPAGTRMTLTGQVFPIMGGTASAQQIQEITRAVDHYLKDPAVGGYRLNTDFHDVKTNMGRLFGFAYGHKENGAMFSHMAMMYSNALYKQGFARKGHEVIASIYHHCRKVNTSRIYPGIPEYVNQRGRGMYPYLTGSASWLLLTMVTRVFGVRGHLGDLVLDPQLVRSQFDAAGEASLGTIFARRFLQISYTNRDKLPVEEYEVKEIAINGEQISFQRQDGRAIIPRDMLTRTAEDKEILIEVGLA
ncbi:MAG: GH36-type glycosyl hydrolase domain-containing protein [Bacillota bacterium]